MQSRELLDTIVKENKGKNTNTVSSFNVNQLLQNSSISEISHAVYSLFCLSHSVSPVVYGITTGFGKFARTVIPVSKLK